MNVLLAVLVVGLGSLAFRLVPLLGARRIPDRVTAVAGWTGLAVLAATTVRGVLEVHDPSVPVAPLLAAVSVGAGLLLAFRGRSVLLATAVGGATYVLTAAAVAALT